MTPTRAIAAVTLLATCVALPARAQNVSAADVLYRDAQSLIASGRTHEACLKFAASQRAEAALSTLVALAACHEKEGRTASAWTELGQAIVQARQAKDAPRETFAREHRDALESRLRRVVLSADPPPRSPLEVRIDDEPRPDVVLGKPFPLDPGEHRITVRAPGKIEWARSIRVTSEPGLEQVTLAATSLPEARVAPQHATTDTTSRTAGFIVGGVGIAALATALVFELVALDKSATAEDEARLAPRGSNPYDGPAGATHQSAVSSQRVALIAGGAGALALAVGAYLVLTGDTASPASASTLRIAPRLDARGGSLGLMATFR